jgi:hypothetical protein
MGVRLRWFRENKTRDKREVLADCSQAYSKGFPVSPSEFTRVIELDEEAAILGITIEEIVAASQD